MHVHVHPSLKNAEEFALAEDLPEDLDMKSFAVLLVAASVALISGCGKDGGGGGDSIDPAAQAEASKIYMQRCTTCHGPNGGGDGPGAADLNPKPRNLSDATWQSSVDDAYIEKIIKLGGAAVGKSAAMPPNPDLATNEPVVKALRAKVRGLKK